MTETQSTPPRWTVSPPQPSSIYVGSQTYVRCLVQAEVAGVNHDPTGDVVSLAFTPRSDPPTAPVSWTAGVWERWGSYQTAGVLVGGIGLVLAQGEYDLWVKITDSPEIPELLAGPLTVS